MELVEEGGLRLVHWGWGGEEVEGGFVRSIVVWTAYVCGTLR